ncbi:MAG: hypothetical protein PHO02_01580 [Candidatus Nanoarchaeia archaeon]|nr:hypothetical protein [Candidatus Nanoarchaeia archaeon]
MNRKTIEQKIITALPGMNENSVDCGLPFYDKGYMFKAQMNEIAEGIITKIFEIVEDAAVAAYRK